MVIIIEDANAKTGAWFPQRGITQTFHSDSCVLYKTTGKMLKQDPQNLLYWNKEESSLTIFISE